MARFLALDWDHQQVCLVSATTKHGSLTIHRAVTWDEQRNPNLVEAEVLGHRLRERLHELEIAPAPALICVGRDRVILKEVRYPAVPAAEEPAIIRFQAIKELTHAPNEVVIDYLPGSDTPEGDRRALVIILRRELLTTYQTFCKAAGLKLAALAPRAIGLAFSVSRARSRETAQQTPSQSVAILTVADRWAEFCVVQEDNLLLTRAMSAPAAGEEGNFLNEVRRSLAVFASQSPQKPVSACYLAGGKQLESLLKNSLTVPVHTLDPFAGMGAVDLPAAERGAFAGAVGLLQARAERRTFPVNFLQPKEPAGPSNLKNVRVLVAAAAVLLVLGSLIFGKLLLAGRDSERDALNDEKKQLVDELALLDEEVRRSKAIADWNDSGVVWLDELYELKERFPNTTSMRLTQLNGNVLERGSDQPASAGTASARPKNKYVAKMELRGVVTDDVKQVDALIARLVADAHYKVDPKRISRNTGPDRDRFSRQFTTQVEIEKRPATSSSATVPESKATGAGNGGAR